MRTHPLIRLFLLTAIIFSIYFFEYEFDFVVNYLIVVLSVSLLGKLGNHYLLIAITIPFLIMLLVVYVFILGRGDFSSATYSFDIYFNILTLTTIIQIIFDIPQRDIFKTFSFFRLPSDSTMTWLAAVSIIKITRRKAEEIIMAKFSQGKMSRYDYLKRIIFLPSILKPLVITSFIEAIERSEYWKSKSIRNNLSRISNNSIQIDKKTTLVFILTGLGILVINLILQDL